ncbi:peptidase S8/S53 domain-containing protein, partial [Blastocladiella britannica]
DRFKGYAATLTPAMAEQLRTNPNVKSVSPVVPMYLAGTQSQPPSWGLPRISERNLNLNQAPYQYPDSAGDGVDVYVVDSGVDVGNPEFGGRARWGVTTCRDCPSYDDHGHGTHCAGTIASTSFGVAKRASIVAVRVVNKLGQGDDAVIVAGITWAANAALAAWNRSMRPSVISMSLAGGSSTAVDAALAAAADNGVTVVVAAGNDFDDACNQSPARSPVAIAVGAADQTDTVAEFSNYGRCVALYAPGVDITSVKIGGGSSTLSGTSMAGPHVTGVAALVLGRNRMLWGDEVKAAIVNGATRGMLKGNLRGSPNLMLFNNI